MAGPWWVVAEGRGTSLTAYVQGPSSTAPQSGFAYSSIEVVGSQSGYADKSVAQEAADIYNQGGSIPDNSSKSAVDAAKSTIPKGGKFSPAGNTNRVQQAGGTVASVPNPFSGLAGIASAVAKIGAVFYDIGKFVTDGKMWRSVGWLLLGILLIAAGVALFAGKQVTPVGRLLKQAASRGT